MALTEYQKFVKKHKHLKKPNGSLDLTKIGALWQKEKGGKSTPKAKPRAKPKSQQARSVRATKPKPKKRPRGKAERKKDDFKKEFIEIARSLNVPISKTSFKFVNGTWRIRITGLGKTIKRAKLGEAMKIVRKRARSKI